jgi:hypothetical protein
MARPLGSLCSFQQSRHLVHSTRWTWNGTGWASKTYYSLQQGTRRRLQFLWVQPTCLRVLLQELRACPQMKEEGMRYSIEAVFLRMMASYKYHRSCDFLCLRSTRIYVGFDDPPRPGRTKWPPRNVPTLTQDRFFLADCSRSWRSFSHFFRLHRQLAKYQLNVSTERQFEYKTKYCSSRWRRIRESI